MLRKFIFCVLLIFFAQSVFTFYATKSLSLERRFFLIYEKCVSHERWFICLPRKVTLPIFFSIEQDDFNALWIESRLDYITYLSIISDVEFESIRERMLNLIRNEACGAPSSTECAEFYLARRVNNQK